MTELEIAPCRPRRQNHALVVLRGLAERPETAGFSVLLEGGQIVFLGAGGWQDTGAVLWPVACGWDPGQRALWMILGPDVISELDDPPYVLVFGDHRFNIYEIPREVRAKGAADAPALARYRPGGVVPAADIPDGRPASVPRREDEAPGVEEHARAQAERLNRENKEREEAARAENARREEEESRAATARTTRKNHAAGFPRYASVLLLGGLAAAAAGYGAYRYFGARPPGPEKLVMTTPSSSPTSSAPPTTPAGSPPAVPSTSPPAAPSPVAPVSTLPPHHALPTYAPPSAPPAPSPTYAPSPPARPTPLAKDCGTRIEPLHIGIMPANLTPEIKLCVIRIWIQNRRVADAASELGNLGGYPPAVLELAKLYDPLSGYPDHFDNPSFAKDKYRQVISSEPENSPLALEARARLDELAKSYPDR